jgi:nucleotidyltransferase substrate binding protein (TIGR01987 family)
MAKYDAERFDLQRENFEKALRRLHEALAQPEDSFVRDSIVQRFEFTFEMAWKTLYRFLRDKGENVAAKAWDVLPVAFESRLISDAEAWERLREYRNDTSHEYDEARAALIVAYIRDAGVAALDALQAEMRRRVP